MDDERGVPDLIQDYARAFAEWRSRLPFRGPFSHRQKFDKMTDEEVSQELDRLKLAIIEQYRVVTPVADAPGGLG